MRKTGLRFPYLPSLIEDHDSFAAGDVRELLEIVYGNFFRHLTPVM